MLDAGECTDDLGAGCLVQFREPVGEGTLTARSEVVADFKSKDGNKLRYCEPDVGTGFGVPDYADFRTALSTSVLPSDQIAPGTL